ncbi:aspartate 1-decarboxylase (aspartate alpha-decarboxylase) [Anaerococcus nagyae]|uniref:Aspartate 1-decarboxylase (Aspartate alpha-decarboxylase) n=2 Tax=Anaerococcus TaxID=165779 RepID=A0A3E2TK22_9FIRM|nr:aspartate 1-decarboxylase (aspartate alpha-decarboxylase) [Anaerococcus nagyae]RGB77333.1 aspartate 1-decarboxylase (aspartate alpha-decarboxylase) [Anaerococcus nagyae]
MRDYKTGREINPKERVLVVNDKVYSNDSFIVFDTSKLDDYPPEVYYDREDIYLGKMFDEGVYILPDIEDILLNYQDQCFSNHDLDDIREFLVKRRILFYKKLEGK